MVGQRFVHALASHPWFRLDWLAASERSAGRSYGEATHWLGEGEMPSQAAGIRVEAARPSSDCPRLVFSALDAKVAGRVERSFARAGHVVLSNARNHRMEPDVPLLVPEINSGHLRLVREQRRRRGWTGAIVTNPNCSTIGLALALAPLRPLGIRRVVATTLQALSGAGHPGVAALDIVGNVVPAIAGEENKIATETLKILGACRDGGIEPFDAVVSAHCNRVPVVDGHLACVSVDLEDPSPERARELLANFSGPPQELDLPSAPARPVRVTSVDDRPQPRLDSGAESGMAVTVGRLRPCTVLGLKFVALVHNTIRGAAGASVLNAELMWTRALL